MKITDRKQITALEYAYLVATKEQLSEDEKNDLIAISSKTKRPNEASPTLISAIGMYMSGSTAEEAMKIFSHEA